MSQRPVTRHQCRFVPAPTTSSAGGPATFTRFRCRCGMVIAQTPGMPVTEWRWKWLGSKKLHALWRKRP